MEEGPWGWGGGVLLGVSSIAQVQNGSQWVGEVGVWGGQPWMLPLDAPPGRAGLQGFLRTL